MGYDRAMMLTSGGTEIRFTLHQPVWAVGQCETVLEISDNALADQVIRIFKSYYGIEIE